MLLSLRDRSVASFLLAALGLSALALVFLLLADRAPASAQESFDFTLAQMAHAARASHPRLAEIMRDLSGFGSTVGLTLLTVGSCAYLALTRRRRTALVVGLSILAASLAVQLLKGGFTRLRPDSKLAHFVETGFSFPSGHASMSAVVFLTLGALVARTHGRARERWFIMGLAILMALLVGASRVALGVHWLSDVLAGWIFGAAWAAFSLALARRVEPRPG
ncbi:phosphatase PAP2 family protein [uncultured Ramlibacter sp.]|uniref:phosphatase PAP2 family protein n=1 Tax=uncultured Ramlibacter sp. TaxID=260755 RepID=UPI002638B7A5|nr:phosphatase PAP2 family protein [uncultured Ramlibacter sp.]